MPSDFEPVFTVTNFHDRPRVGIANYRGAPHAFECEFDDREDDYSDVHRQKPVDAEVFNLALEQWAIWLRWETAFRRGEVALETHPALPHEHERYKQLSMIVAPAVEVPKDAPIRAIGRFRSRETSPGEWTTEVSWETVSA
jgi:hypothetical protein